MELLQIEDRLFYLAFPLDCETECVREKLNLRLLIIHIYSKFERLNHKD